MMECMPNDDSTILELYDRPAREKALAEAIAKTRRMMRDPNSIMHQSWITSKEQRKRWLASENPFEEYPEDAEYWVAHCYDRSLGYQAYANDYSRLPEWRWPDPRPSWLVPLMRVIDFSGSPHMQGYYREPRPY